MFGENFESYQPPVKQDDEDVPAHDGDAAVASSVAPVPDGEVALDGTAAAAATAAASPKRKKKP